MKNKKILSAVLAVLTVTALAVGSLALFTDRFQTQTKLTAGTLDLALDQAWEDDNLAIKDNVKPGHGIKLNYTLRNGGNMGARVKETLVVSCDKVMSQSAPELALYAAADVTVDSTTGIATVKSGKTPLSSTYGTFTDGGKNWSKLTYNIGEFILDGNLEDVNGTAGKQNTKTGNFVLIFSDNANNNFQGATLKFEYMAQGLQYGNTNSATWADAKVITQSATIGGSSVKVVPAAPVVTP